MDNGGQPVAGPGATHGRDYQRERCRRWRQERKARLADATFERAARRYAARHIQIAELTKQVFAIPGCERLQGTEECFERLYRSGPNEGRFPLSWWEAMEQEIAGLCMPCQSRVAVWRERWKLRKTIGGLKRALIAAYKVIA